MDRRRPRRAEGEGRVSEPVPPRRASSRRCLPLGSARRRPKELAGGRPRPLARRGRSSTKKEAPLLRRVDARPAGAVRLGSAPEANPEREVGVHPGAAGGALRPRRRSGRDPEPGEEGGRGQGLLRRPGAGIGLAEPLPRPPEGDRRPFLARGGQGGEVDGPGGGQAAPEPRLPRRDEQGGRRLRGRSDEAPRPQEPDRPLQPGRGGAPPDRHRPRHRSARDLPEADGRVPLRELGPDVARPEI